MSPIKPRDSSLSIRKHHPQTATAASFFRAGLLLSFIALIVFLGTPGCASISEAQIRPEVREVQQAGSGKDEYLVRGTDFSTVDHGLVIKDTGKSVILFRNGKVSSVSHETVWDKLGSPWAKALKRRMNENGNKGHYQAKGKSYNGYLKPLENSGNRKLFVSWRLKLSESPGHSKGSNKFIRIWDQTDGKGTRISWTQMHMTYNGMAKPSWEGWPGKGREWNQMSLWVDGEQGVIEARVNDTLSHSVDDFKKADTAKGLNIKLIGFDPNRSKPYEDMEVGIDDLYVSSTLARVVISDQPNWAAAQSRQSMQIPIQWKDDEIRFIYQPAEYLNSEHYLYVVDKYGAANAKGFPLVKAKRAVGETRTEPEI